MVGVAELLYWEMRDDPGLRVTEEGRMVTGLAVDGGGWLARLLRLGWR